MTTHPVPRRHATAPMPSAALSRKTLVACAAMAFAVTACGGSGGAPSPATTESSTPAAPSAEASGQALFAQAGRDCIQCHADPAALRRGAADAAAVADRIQAAVAANTGRMGDAAYGFANLTRTELLDLGTYIVAAGSGSPSAPPVSPPVQPSAAVQCSSTGSTAVSTQVFASGLSSPWGMAFLPDGRVLVTQKSGSLVLVSADGSSRTPLTWGSPAPQVRDRGQGGLLDVALDPDFATTPWVYFTYSEPGPNSTSGTALGRAILQGTTLVNFQRLYQQTPKLDYSDVHYGSRLAFRSDKTLFVSLGDRGYEDPSRTTSNFTQSAANSVGKLIRINRDGSVPSGNPSFPGQAGALPEVWSIGHRNPQGLTYDATTDTLWSSEHGPQGGDEVNRVLPGANHGWPLRSYGCPYGSPQGAACRVGGGVHRPVNGVNFTEPLTFWAPTSMAPSNMIVYRGARFPDWNGQLFVGGLGGRLWRIALNNGAYASCEGLPVNQRVRDVRQGPDGGIWLLTDGGDIRRLVR